MCRPLCGKCRSARLNGRPIEATDQNFGRFIDRSGLPAIVDFWAPWCGPSVFIQVAAEMATRATFIKLDTQANPDTATNYRIRSIPTLMVFYGGREVARLSGALPKAQFQQWLYQQQPFLTH